MNKITIKKLKLYGATESDIEIFKSNNLDKVKWENVHRIHGDFHSIFYNYSIYENAEWEFDTNGNPKSCTLQLPEGESFTYFYTYNDKNQLIELKTIMDHFKFEYYETTNLLKKKYVNDILEEEFYYNDKTLLLTKLINHLDFKELLYEYNEKNDLIKFIDVKDNYIFSIDYTYLKNGSKIATIIDSKGKIKEEVYDSKENIIKVVENGVEMFNKKYYFDKNDCLYKIILNDEHIIFKIEYKE